MRSHIIPRAIAHDIKEGAKHVVMGSRHHFGAKPSQGGAFSDHLLCSEHEAKTASIDKYGVEFVRRANNIHRFSKNVRTILVPNPQPSEIRRFSLLNIWREVKFQQIANKPLTLGPFDSKLTDFLFRDGPDLGWPIIVNRTYFTTGSHDATTFAVHPYRVKFASRSGWLFVLSGLSFFVISDHRGLPRTFQSWRADANDPAPVIVGDPQPMTGIRSFQPIFDSMRIKGGKRLPK